MAKEKGPNSKLLNHCLTILIFKILLLSNFDYKLKIEITKEIKLAFEKVSKLKCSFAYDASRTVHDDIKFLRDFDMNLTTICAYNHSLRHDFLMFYSNINRTADSCSAWICQACPSFVCFDCHCKISINSTKIYVCVMSFLKFFSLNLKVRILKLFFGQKNNQMWHSNCCQVDFTESMILKFLNFSTSSNF